MAGVRDALVIDDDAFILIDDDDDHDHDQDGDIEIADFLPSSKPPPNSQSIDEDLPPTTYIGPRAMPLGMRGSRPSQPNRSTFRINSTFQAPNWGFKTSKSLSTSQKHVTASQRNRSECLGTSQSFTRCPLPRSDMSSFTGSAQQPIQLDDQDVEMGLGVEMGRCGSSRRPTQLGEEDVVMDIGQSRASKSQAGGWRSQSNSMSSFSMSHHQGASSVDFIILDDPDQTLQSSPQEHSPTLQDSLEQTPKPKYQGEIIDLESLEDAAGEGPEMLQIEEVYEQEIEAQKRRRKKSTIQYERRNPSIVGPWQRIANTTRGKDVTLKANKTIELKDQSFIRIKDILHNTESQEIRIRGHRLQRARELNGLLEKKLNEVVLFLEVDQDDPRVPTEQSTVEVSLDDFERVRSVRFTNQKFPLARNCDPNEFRNKEHAAQEGGLTVRWKYTCTYASAADRHHNVYKERTMERLRADECTPGFEISDEDRRTQWRGETVLGGAYRPSWEPKDVVMDPDRPGTNPISQASGPRPETISNSDMANHVVILDDEEMDSQAFGSFTKRKGKRNHSATSPESSGTTLSPNPPTKRIRRHGSDGVEETREGVARINLRAFVRGSPMAIDQPSTPKDCFPQTIDLSSDLPQIIDLISSDLSNPSPAKAPRRSLQIPNPPHNRIAGQTYTYGDAFCGGGGSSRGATMAGLRLKWGFDFNKHACLTWRANFPYSHCYQMAAHEFVDQAQRAADNGQPDMMKVDILHLSPPCQFFSPAHTIEGVDDEMNVASLFAVQMVIDVSRPRIVTLEQTFGIACPRFRFYFNALIQMFTTHDFSVRWAIVPLAQWGLPQRRMRLIVIASCPGEALPRMPLPTHSAPGSGPLDLLPHVSVNTTLKSIELGAADHDINSVMWVPDRYMPPWDGSKILPRAMTTSGGQNYHPSGMRDLTLREYACLQGFPTGHVFRGNYVKKQIGNAVPPVVAKVLFGSIKADLEKVDGIEGPELIE
ncbi:S-adenosyl-L-methionine-dependent methyltransferase [Rhexocercosporidium sp. MPI-PUGE-AT-0058]|nr:S-adenosyl-L-methionine-dependent methyltransferase [Rhexocercosporidium sp. MPI-PUGE-AT-0058]